MLKEQVAELLNWYGQANPYIDWRIEGNDETKNYRREQAKDFLNLFKAEIEKLTAIDEETSWNIYQLNGGRGISPRDQVNSVASFQLSEIMKQLLDLMGK